MNFFEVVDKRRSVRRFTESEVPESVMRKCLKAAILAPNSSNLQPWEFYWIRDEEKKKKVVEACFSQNAAKTAKEIVISVSRIDTWKRNRNMIVEEYEKKGKLLPLVDKYYNKLIPMAYTHDRFGIFGLLKRFVYIFLSIVGYFKPIQRSPLTKHQLFESVTKSTALACQNFMMALVAEGFDSCPMEGFDEKRIKKLLKLNWQSHVVMIFGIGEADKDGVYGERFRIDDRLVIKEV
ncbi:nitroreductase family protein [Flavobacteriales bacterium]|jgi:nitroreductase|nr:nitroreductase family protein [Flavobacteriales bacterium]